MDGEYKHYVKLPKKIRAKKMPKAFEVDSPEGKLQGSEGDYLVEGEDGQEYPCKCHIFECTYEEVSY